MRAQRSITVRKFGHLPIPEILVITCPLTPTRPPARSTDRPSVRTTGIPMSITQLTGMATQMQLEVILEGNGIVTRVLQSRDN